MAQRQSGIKFRIDGFLPFEPGVNGTYAEADSRLANIVAILQNGGIENTVTSTITARRGPRPGNPPPAGEASGDTPSGP